MRIRIRKVKREYAPTYLHFYMRLRINWRMSYERPNWPVIVSALMEILKVNQTEFGKLVGGAAQSVVSRWVSGSEPIPEYAENIKTLARQHSVELNGKPIDVTESDEARLRQDLDRSWGMADSKRTREMIVDVVADIVKPR